MQNDNQPVNQPPQPQNNSIPTVPVVGSAMPVTVASPARNAVDYLLLVLGVVAIGSFIFSSGFAFGFTILAFFIIGLLAMLSSIFRPKSYAQNVNGEMKLVKVKQERSLIGKIGIGLLILAAIPLLGFFCLIAFFLILFTLHPPQASS